MLIHIWYSMCYGDKKIFCRSSLFCKFEMFQDPEMGQQFLTHSQNGSKPETGRNINISILILISAVRDYVTNKITRTIVT